MLMRKWILPLAVLGLTIVAAAADRLPETLRSRRDDSISVRCRCFFSISGRDGKEAASRL